MPLPDVFDFPEKVFGSRNSRAGEGRQKCSSYY